LSEKKRLDANGPVRQLHAVLRIGEDPNVHVSIPFFVRISLLFGLIFQGEVLFGLTVGLTRQFGLVHILKHQTALLQKIGYDKTAGI